MSEDGCMQFWHSAKVVWIQLDSLKYEAALKEWTPQDLYIAQRKALARYAYSIARHVGKHAGMDVSQIPDIIISPPQRDTRLLDALRQELIKRRMEEGINENQ